MGRTMTRNLAMALTVLIFFSLPSFAERRGDQGLGLMIGNPSGFSWKMWLDESFGIDAAAGIDRGEFDLHTTILWHDFNWAKASSDKTLQDITSNGDFPFYVGIGPRILFAHKTEFGVRIPFRLSYLPHQTD